MRKLGIWLLEGAAWAIPMALLLHLLDIEVTWKLMMVCVASCIIADVVDMVSGCFK